MVRDENRSGQTVEVAENGSSALPLLLIVVVLFLTPLVYDLFQGL